MKDLIIWSALLSDTTITIIMVKSETNLKIYAEIVKYLARAYILRSLQKCDKNYDFFLVKQPLLKKCYSQKLYATRLQWAATLFRATKPTYRNRSWRCSWRCSCRNVAGWRALIAFVANIILPRSASNCSLRVVYNQWVRLLLVWASVVYSFF